MLVSDLLQTIKHRLNRSAAFPLTADKIQKLNACIDKLVSGGRIFEDEEIDAFLNPVETTPQQLVDLSESLMSVTLALGQEGFKREDYITPEQEKLLQSIANESQALGLYEMTGNPLLKDESAADLEPGGLMAINPELAINTELTNLPELPAVAPVDPVQIGLPGDNVHTLLPEDHGQLSQEDADKLASADAQSETVAAGDSEQSEVVASGDSAVAEITENTNDVEAANVEPTPE